MAAKKKKKHKKKSHKKKHFFSGVLSGRGIETTKHEIIASLGMRFAGGGVNYIVRRQGYDFPKVRIFFPLGVAIGAAQGWIPFGGEALKTIAVDQTVNALIDTTDFLKRIFDWRFMDKATAQQPASTPTAGLSARSLAETRRAIDNMSGLVDVGNPRVYAINGVQDIPFRRGMSRVDRMDRSGNSSAMTYTR